MINSVKNLLQDMTLTAKKTLDDCFQDVTITTTTGQMIKDMTATPNSTHCMKKEVKNSPWIDKKKGSNKAKDPDAPKHHTYASKFFNLWMYPRLKADSKSSTPTPLKRCQRALPE